MYLTFRSNCGHLCHVEHYRAQYVSVTKYGRCVRSYQLSLYAIVPRRPRIFKIFKKLLVHYPGISTVIIWHPHHQMQGLSSSFFLDHSAILRVGKRTVEETKAHLVLLSDDVDCNLSVAAILDGSTIDFLFGARDNDARSVIAKANNVKKFLRGLDTDGQEAAAKFYLVVFQSMARYQKNLSHPCSCLWASWLQLQFRDDIEEAFNHLAGIVTEKNILHDQ